MHVVFLAGGIASGKSTVARELERRGAWRIDLDALSRDVCLPGSDVLAELAQAFGPDVLDARTGELSRGLLARRAFASAEKTTELESIMHPAIFAELARRLATPQDADVCVVEVPLLDRALAAGVMPDEVVCVTCPTEVRRVRAVGRGMDAADFDRRDAQQPSQDYLRSHADTELHNDGEAEDLLAQVDAWWQSTTKGH